jgi:hypothetical protein
MPEGMGGNMNKTTFSLPVWRLFMKDKFIVIGLLVALVTFVSYVDGLGKYIMNDKLLFFIVGFISACLMTIILMMYDL